VIVVLSLKDMIYAGARLQTGHDSKWVAVFLKWIDSKEKRKMLTFEALSAKQEKIAVVGLGYVGLPLAIHLSRHFDVVGYDFKSSRIAELSSGKDRTLEVSDEAMAAATVVYTDDPQSLGDCRLIIVAVPTPIDQYRIPDLTPLCGASESTGRHLTHGSCVVSNPPFIPGRPKRFACPSSKKNRAWFSAGISAWDIHRSGSTPGTRFIRLTRS
jgi:hypothetical protein